MNNQRYGMLFDTSADIHYYYDAGTGKVVSCTNDEKLFIKQILKNEIAIKDAKNMNQEFGEFADEENLFSDHEWNFLAPSKEEFINSVKGNCHQIVLELTEGCNLRCEYCVYNEHHPNFRGYSNKKMTFETAKKGIDLVLHNYEGEEFALSFYGGEPLVNFPLMKECIEYTRKAYPNRNVTYSFTTNLTLLTQEMVDYFKTLENIDILCSLDGPEKIHDKYRKDVNGDGTFERAIEKFNVLRKEYYNPAKKRNLMINCVMVPPYTKKKLKELYCFFYEELKVPKEISCNYSYVDLGDMKVDNATNVSDKEEWQISPLEEYAADDFLEKKEDARFWKMINLELYKVANRDIAQKGVIEGGSLHGNCVPGQRRVYVTVDGDLRTCEKVGNIPCLGNCEKGYDYDKSYKFYIEDYIKYYQPKCNNCWARNMCSACYSNTISDNCDTPYISGEMCNSSRRLVREMFINYFRLFEKDKEGLEIALSKVKLK